MKNLVQKLTQQRQLFLCLNKQQLFWSADLDGRMTEAMMREVTVRILGIYLAGFLCMETHFSQSDK